MHLRFRMCQPEDLPCRTFQVWQLLVLWLQNISGLAAKSAGKFSFGSIYARNLGIFAAKVEKFCKRKLVFDHVGDKMDGKCEQMLKDYPQHSHEENSELAGSAPGSVPWVSSIILRKSFTI